MKMDAATPGRKRGVAEVHRDIFDELAAMELRDLYVHKLNGETSTTFSGRLRVWVQRKAFKDDRDFRMFSHDGLAYVVRIR